VRVKAFLKGEDRWQVSYYADTARRKQEEVGQILISDRTGRVEEAWTGVQVAWTMARGYPGAFGRRVNAPYIWLPLCLLFLLPFLRRPLTWFHLDLVVLLAFSVSYAVFGAADIGLSVPLVYPLLVYLLARMLCIAWRRARDGAMTLRPPIELRVGAEFLGIAIVFLLGFRIGLNVTSSNVIDVGYAGVIGADRLLAGEELYGNFPKDNPHGDTYGPVGYFAYVPFEVLFPWRGAWDNLPAAHAASIAFDLATTLVLWLLGRRLRGPRLGLLLAYLWLCFPFSLLVANSNTNDALVPLLVGLALLVLGRPALRGVALALAGLAKFAPLGLGPLLATAPRGEGRPDLRAAVTTTAVFAVSALVLLAPTILIEGGLLDMWERSVRFQADRESPFSIWGLWELEGPQRLVQLAAAVLAVAVAFVPRRRDAVTVAALSAAVLIALQLGVSHWFYLYIVWFAPLVWIAVLAAHAEPPNGVTAAAAGPAPARSSSPGAPPPG
jgi:hypothetical protein